MVLLSQDNYKNISPQTFPLDIVTLYKIYTCLSLPIVSVGWSTAVDYYWNEIPMQKCNNKMTNIMPLFQRGTNSVSTWLDSEIMSEFGLFHPCAWWSWYDCSKGVEQWMWTHILTWVVDTCTILNMPFSLFCSPLQPITEYWCTSAPMLMAVCTKDRLVSFNYYM